MRKPRSSNNVSGSQRFSDMGDPCGALCGNRHARPWAWHPRLPAAYPRKAVDGRASGMPGHDGVQTMEMGLSPLPAQVLADRDVLRLERLAQHRDAGTRIGAAAHEAVDCGVMRL